MQNLVTSCAETERLGSIRLELRFDKALSEAITCLLYLEYDNCVRIDRLRTVSTDF